MSNPADKPTQPAALQQPPYTDKHYRVTGLGIADTRPPANGIGPSPGADKVTGQGTGGALPAPTGTPFAKPVKR